VGDLLQGEVGLAAAAVDGILVCAARVGQCGAWVSTCLKVRVGGGVVGDRTVLVLFRAVTNLGAISAARRGYGAGQFLRSVDIKESVGTVVVRFCFQDKSISSFALVEIRRRSPEL
jgi:hypothetical protein